MKFFARPKKKANKHGREVLWFYCEIGREMQNPFEEVVLAPMFKHRVDRPANRTFNVSVAGCMQ